MDEWNNNNDEWNNNGEDNQAEESQQHDENNDQLDNSESFNSDDSANNEQEHEQEHDSDTNNDSDDSHKENEEDSENDLEALLDEEETNDAVDDFDEAYTEDEEYADTTDWEWVKNLIVLVRDIHKSDEKNVAAVSRLFFDSETALKPLALLEQLENVLLNEDDERATMTDFVLRDMVRKSSFSEMNPLEIQEATLELADWAYNVEDDSKKHISHAIASIAETFPKYQEKKDEEGNTIYDNGDPVLEKIEYAPKRTTRNTSGTDVITALAELHTNIDAEAVARFMEWYADIADRLVGEEE